MKLPVKVLGMCGSLRSQSTNLFLAEYKRRALRLRRRAAPAQVRPGGRSQYHLRQVCVFLDLFVLNKPEVFLSAFDGTFDKESSELVSSDKQELLVQQLEALKELSLKLNPQGSNPEL